MTLKDITVIIPMVDFSKENLDLLKNAVGSVPEECGIILSISDGNKKEAIASSIGDVQNEVNFVVSDNGEDTSFASMVNRAVEAVQTKWFSILEYDDTYTEIWGKSAEEWMQAKDDVSVFMFLEDIYEWGTQKYLGFGNESVLASAFSEVIGYLDNEALQNFFDYYMTGSIFNVEDWKEVGPLKNLIKVTFWYEWLLRATKKAKKVFVIPRVGYRHNMGKKNSLTEIYKDTLSEEEIQWWFDLAKRDYFFKDMKDKEYYTYKPSENDNNED